MLPTGATGVVIKGVGIKGESACVYVCVCGCGCGCVCVIRQTSCRQVSRKASCERSISVGLRVQKKPERHSNAILSSIQRMRVFPRNRRGGVLFRSYTRSRANFASFCCKPSAISPSAARIARARRGDSICAVGPPNDAGLKIWIFVCGTGTAPKNDAPAHRLLGNTWWRSGSCSI